MEPRLAEWLAEVVTEVAGKRLSPAAGFGEQHGRREPQPNGGGERSEPGSE